MAGTTNRASRWGQVAAIADRQHGVISRRQLRDLGISDGTIGRAVRAGSLHPQFRGTFAVGRAGIDERGRMLSAVFACGAGTLVSHRTAGVLLGLLETGPKVIDVISPEAGGRQIDGINTHDVPRPSGTEAGKCDSVPCTSPSRTLVDLAGILGEASLRKAVERSAVQGILDIGETERVLSNHRRRGAPLLRRILGEWPRDKTSGSRNPPDLRSELEARFLALVVAAGLPTPECNRVLEVDGHRLMVDFLWRKQRFVVETDGRRTHDNAAAFERDRLRDRILQLGGYRVAHFTYRQVAAEPDSVVAATRRLLGNPIG